MWNPFRKKSSAATSNPETVPIHNLDAIDLVGKRRDGGVDLFIVASTAIDDRPQTLNALRQKIATYLVTVELPQFQQELGNPPRERIAIVISCDHPVHPAARALIEETRLSAALRGIAVSLRSPGTS